MLQRYSKFAPTGFDARGAFLPDQQDWLVVPVSQTRDSGCLDQSNFAAALAILGGESETCEVHRFGHWGPGWFEIIIVDPSREQEAEAIQAALENYPVLDDEDHSRREWEDYEQSWESYGARDFADALADVFELGDTAKDFLRDKCQNELVERFYRDHSNEPYYHDYSGGCVIPVGRAAQNSERPQVASLLKSLRAAS